MDDFASYEKNVQATVVRITHKINPTLNMKASQLADLVARIPPSAVLTMIEDDQDCEPAWPPHGTLTFEEEQITG